MGLCASSEHLEQVQEADESIVYVKDEQGGGGGRGLECGARKVASLFSQRGKKGPNQDSVILCQGFGMEDGVFVGAFDGHGRCGQVISKLVRDYLPFMILSHRNALFLAGDDGDDLAFSDASPPPSSTDSSGRSSPQAASAQVLEEWREACTNAFAAMDGELKLQANLDCSFSGTTAVCAIKQGKDLVVANLGDSRAVLATMSETGYLQAVQLTVDHKPSVPEEAARIKRSEGRVFGLKDEPGVMRVWLPAENSPGLAMARSLGDFRLKRHGVISTPEVTSRRVSAADLFIVLATDGVWDVLSNEEVVSIVCATPRKQHASKAVVEAAVQRWRSKFPTSRVDDCSAVCLFLRDQATWATAAAAARKSRRAATTPAPL
ncbi:probable protein phosphatase 2C 12 [Oryza brachyantha]|uniref:probable protein phosphatase 2C 12 n=1 Tax=Oryza brachyantha TaxID=4533 RepID=UPI0003EA8E17|nr:probable protein phosphatase 2C 12 [Oryza brachyantha]